MTEAPSAGRLLKVRGLRVDHRVSDRSSWLPLLSGVDLDLEPGEAAALVGPSGCGKSLMARALLGLLPSGFRWQGELAWSGTPLTDPHGEAWRQVRGGGLGLILQEPLTSLNPVLTVGEQVAETLRIQQGLSRARAEQGAVGLLAETRIPDPERIARCYAHQLSGGLRQRVLLAAALACGPDLLIADEPTTALDVSVQKEILALINRIRREREMALLFITHDLNLVPLLADKVMFMAAGRITRVMSVQRMPLPASPKLQVPARSPAEPILSARGLVVRYPRLERPAVAGVDLDLRPGQATGLLGESGCGKTSLGRALGCHVPLVSGTMTLAGVPYPSGDRRTVRTQRRQVQVLFQDPGSSLDPRQTVGGALREAAGPDGPGAGALLVEVGLSAALVDRYPHQLSGGQRQRVALARCLAPAPSVLVADEPTSALDAATRDQVLQLLAQVMDGRGLALLIISHDLEVLQAICGEIQVMYGGTILERLPGGEFFRPRHPYTRELQAAVPRSLRGDPALWGQTPLQPATDLVKISGGCPRYGICPAQKISCGKELPPLKMVSADHWLRCPEAETNGPPHFIDTL